MGCKQPMQFEEPSSQRSGGSGGTSAGSSNPGTGGVTSSGPGTGGIGPLAGSGTDGAADGLGSDGGSIGSGASDALAAEVPVFSATCPAGKSCLTARKLAAGDQYTCAVLMDGAVTCWGSNIFGQLGIGATTAAVYKPVKVGGVSGAVDIAAGRSHTCAVVSGGAVLCWGRGEAGQLGDGKGTSSLVPVRVTGLMGAVRVDVGIEHGCALLADGTVRCWGSGHRGPEDGAPDTALSQVPELVDAVSLEVGANFSCVQRRDKSMWCWGQNSHGVLGAATPLSAAVPVRVHGYYLATGISVGFDSACYWSGKVAMCWGSNSWGELGHDDPSNEQVAQVSALFDVAAVSMGVSHGCALTEAGQVRCWGANSNGGLGYDNLKTLYLPAPPVPGLSDVTQVVAGGGHSCALKRDGQVYCWGSNGSGQLGNGAIIGTSRPSAVLSF